MSYHEASLALLALATLKRDTRVVHGARDKWRDTRGRSSLGVNIYKQKEIKEIRKLRANKTKIYIPGIHFSLEPPLTPANETNNINKSKLNLNLL